MGRKISTGYEGGRKNSLLPQKLFLFFKIFSVCLSFAPKMLCRSLKRSTKSSRHCRRFPCCLYVWRMRMSPAASMEVRPTDDFLCKFPSFTGFFLRIALGIQRDFESWTEDLLRTLSSGPAQSVDPEDNKEKEHDSAAEEDGSVRTTVTVPWDRFLP